MIDRLISCIFGIIIGVFGLLLWCAVVDPYEPTFCPQMECKSIELTGLDVKENDQKVLDSLCSDSNDPTWIQYDFRNVEDAAYALCKRKSIDVNEPFFLACPVCGDAKCVNKEYSNGKYGCATYGFGVKGNKLCCGLCKKLFGDDWVLIGTKMVAEPNKGIINNN